MNPKAIHYPGSGAESPEHNNMQVVPAMISHLHSEDFEYTQKLKLMVIRSQNQVRKLYSDAPRKDSTTDEKHPVPNIPDG